MNKINKQQKKESVVFDDRGLTMYERTCADDFPIIEQMLELNKHLSKLYGRNTVRELEEFLHGLSYAMQYTIGMRIMDYQLQGVLLSTGVKHVDDFLSTFVKKLRPYSREIIDYYRGISN